MSGALKLQFKVQPYQTNAVNAVVDCFSGQPMVSGINYRIDPGSKRQTSICDTGFKNADIALSEAQVLANICKVQRRQTLPCSQSLTDFTVVNARGERTTAPKGYTSNALAASRYHLDIEMETGTGKTYCYIKTLFEMNKRYGWSKFIIMVPSIAIREGVCQALQITADHFAESYRKKARFFIYHSKRLCKLEGFSSDAGINVMVINTQAFNARGADNRRIYEELDDFQSRKPIDVIASNRPILILDEPQKMEGDATMQALPKFKPLFILRYSATHRTQHNRVHRLNALDAYNQKLVKKIAVRGIQTRGLAGTNAYLYLEGIDISKQAPVARIEMEVKLKTGEIKRQLRRLEFRDDLFTLSEELDQYKGFTIAQIDYNADTVEFTNGAVLTAGEATGDISECDIRRIQIRETIKAHLDKEKQLFSQGVKVLSLFFIDKVNKYRDYSQTDAKGEYARIFEEEYERLKGEYLSEQVLDNAAHRKHLAAIDVAKTHNGYFSIDKKTNRLKDPKVGARAVDSDDVDSDDVDAYGLILKDKESLLTLPGPSDSTEQRAKREVRFIFSHSALREGWDNPNVFVMCMLKHSDNTISRRQEVGRGLRLSVNQHGDRMDHPAAIVHDINVLTVVASESYKDFVGGLQQEISVFSDAQLPQVSNDRKSRINPLNTNFKKKEFQALWSRINQKAVYRVDFDSDELVEKCVDALDSQLHVTPLQYIVQEGVQDKDLTDKQLKAGDGFKVTATTTQHGGPVYSQVKYDLLGKIAENVQLTRRSTANILSTVKASVFAQFQQNPEHFIAEASRIIREQKATMIIEGLKYDALADRHDVDIFTGNQTVQDFSHAGDKLKKHIYDYVVTGSEVERHFVNALDSSTEVVVYAKLPRGFLIPTPVGNYNPDWAISFRRGDVKSIYFIAETKGSMSTMHLRGIEIAKIECAKKFFTEISRKIPADKVKYDVVTDYDKLMEIVYRAT